jgi:hypothetical protein
MIAKAIAQIPPPAAVATTASTEAPASLPLETNPIEQAPSPSPCATGQEPPCDAAPSAANAASIAEAEPPPPSPPATEPQSIQATSTPSFPAAKPVPAPAPKATPGAPVVWFLDDQQEQASGAAGAFAINGMNASDQPFLKRIA